MAGHKFSGYIMSLWQALFAAFTQTFTRIFQLISSSTSAASKPRPATTSGQDSPESQNPPASTPTSDTLPTTAPQLDDPPDLERGQPQQEVEAMAAKKRGGNKRSSINGAQPTTTSSASNAQQRGKENLGSEKQMSQAVTSTPAENRKTPLGAHSQTGVTDARDVSQKYDTQKPAGTLASGKNPSHASSTKQFGNGSSNNNKVGGLASDRETLEVAGFQAPVTTAVAPAERQHENQKTGSHIQTGTQTPDSVPMSSNATKKNTAMPYDGQVDQAAASIDRLTLDDHTPGPEKALTKDTAAVEAAGVPIVVVNPAPGQPPIALKPLAPLVTPPSQVLPGLIEPETEEGKRERAIHLSFMREALDMGDSALSINETPVGCVLVYKNRIIAKGMNATNITRNGTRHAEFMALSALLSHQPDADVKDVAIHDEALWGDVDASDGHIYPYGQKLHPSPRVDRDIIQECILYVTVEPCVMCASLLRQLRVKKVYFGAVNDKFGGTGGVFRIHANSKAVAKPNNDRPYQNGYGPHEIDRIQRGRAAAMPREDDDGDGGNVEPGYLAEGGFLRDEAVSLLRRFYVQENGRAPQPRKKEGRAARLYAMENAAANGGVLIDADGNILPESPSEDEPRSLDGDSTSVLAA
ncbi:tRNA-specific adenosine deaminase subunit TAD2 [Seiridium cupressi]